MFADDAVVVALLTEDETRRCAHASEFFSCQIRQQFHCSLPIIHSYSVLLPGVVRCPSIEQVQ